jgi:SAM-dependent methyltransferase
MNAEAMREKIREQFESVPYPSNPVEDTPVGAYDGLFIHSVVTPYYLQHQRVIDTQGLVILDAGCGTGYTSLLLAVANPGARIIGVDPSDRSLEFARQRFAYHGLEGVAEFHAMPLENIGELGLQFDYINCDEVLYLLPDLDLAMRALSAVLKPQGILRGNLNNIHQRGNHYRGQELFRLMGLMDDNPGDMEIELVMDTLTALKPSVALKQQTWDIGAGRGKNEKELVLLNYLLRGDRGYTIPEMFATLQQSNLQFLSMVQWRDWEVMDLFSDPENLPMMWEMMLPELSVEQRLHTYELLHPVHRLLDFWAAIEESAPSIPVANLSVDQWQAARIHLHPVLRTEDTKAALIQAVSARQSFEISQYVPKMTRGAVMLPYGLAAALLPLWDGPQDFGVIVDRLRQIEPVDRVTLGTVELALVQKQLVQLLTHLEAFLYVLVETP